MGRMGTKMKINNPVQPGAVSTPDGLRLWKQDWEQQDWAERSRTSPTAGPSPVDRGLSEQQSVPRKGLWSQRLAATSSGLAVLIHNVGVTPTPP